MGEDGVPISLGIIIASAILGALLMVGLLLLALFLGLAKS